MLPSGRVTDPYASSLSAGLPQIAFSEEIFLSFLIEKLFDGRNQIDRSGWWIATSHAITSTKTPRLSLMALATMFYGRAHGLQDVVRKAKVLYGEALPSLRADIASSEEAWSFGTLASVTTLSMFEVSCPMPLPVRIVTSH
jgi:hypothetical protein